MRWWWLRDRQVRWFGWHAIMMDLIRWRLATDKGHFQLNENTQLGIPIWNWTKNFMVGMTTKWSFDCAGIMGCCVVWCGLDWAVEEEPLRVLGKNGICWNISLVRCWCNNWQSSSSLTNWTNNRNYYLLCYSSFDSNISIRMITTKIQLNYYYYYQWSSKYIEFNKIIVLLLEYPPSFNCNSESSSSTSTSSMGSEECIISLSRNQSVIDN